MFGKNDMAPERVAAGKTEVAANKKFVSGVDSAQSDFDKALKNAKDTFAQANKQGNKEVAASAKGLIDQLNTVVKPTLQILQKSNNAGEAYTGDISAINKALGGGAPGSGPSGVILDGGSSNNTSATGSASVTDAAGNPIDKTTSDAFSVLSALFTQYNLGSLSDTIVRMMKMGLTAQEAMVKLKYDTTKDTVTGKAWNDAYTTRFAGNEKRKAAGLNALSEAEYLNLEDSYAQTLKSYGLGNMLDTSRTVNEAKFANYIGSDISAVEFKDRIATVEDRIVNADPAIKQTFKQFYPNLTDKDLVAYFLDPNSTIGKLKEKATSAEIGAAALGQGLGVNKETSEDLARYGIDRAGALQGYAQIGEVLPTSQKLSDIYGESGITYNQASGEAEFLKNNANAAEQRKRLKSMERAQFQGDSGVNSQVTFSKVTPGAF